MLTELLLVCTQEGQAVSGVDNVLVTAASRGIIQREHQRGALFYKNYSQANPFDHVTKDDLDAYRRDVERKEKRRAGALQQPCFMCSFVNIAICGYASVTYPMDHGGIMLLPCFSICT